MYLNVTERICDPWTEFRWCRNGLARLLELWDELEIHSLYSVARHKLIPDAVRHNGRMEEIKGKRIIMITESRQEEGTADAVRLVCVVLCYICFVFRVDR